MKAYIINIGDEILIGQIVNTNAAWMAKELNALGIAIHRIETVSDDKQDMIQALEAAFQVADLVLLTGGLGPTKDDVTKHALTAFFDTELAFHEPTYKRIEQFFALKKIPVTDLHRLQCFLPVDCTLITNPKGSAPAMWFEKEGKIAVAMPGVPYEMKALMTREILPKLAAKAIQGEILHHSIETAGVGETTVAKHIEHIEENLPSNFKLAFLPHLGSVTLRLSATGEDKVALQKAMDEQVGLIKAAIPDFIYGDNGEKLEEAIGKLLKSKGKTMGTAESCTGGFISHKITSIAGSSEYYKGSIIAYSNGIKIKMLDVQADTLEQYGAVSEQTVREMVEGTLETLGVDYAIAVSGIAGPGGERPGKPVGTIWTAFGEKGNIRTRKLQLGRDRLKNIQLTTTYSLNELRKFLLAG